MDNTTQQAATIQHFIDEETEREKHLLEALAALEDKPHLQSEIAELAKKVETLNQLLKNAKENEIPAAAKKAHEEDRESVIHAVEGAVTEMQQSLSDFKNASDHFVAMVEGTQTSVFGHLKMKKKTLLESFAEVKQKLDDVVSSFESAGQHASSLVKPSAQ